VTLRNLLSLSSGEGWGEALGKLKKPPCSGGFGFDWLVVIKI